MDNSLSMREVTFLEKKLFIKSDNKIRQNYTDPSILNTSRKNTNTSTNKNERNITYLSNLSQRPEKKDNFGKIVKIENTLNELKKQREIKNEEENIRDKKRLLKTKINNLINKEKYFETEKILKRNQKSLKDIRTNILNSSNNIFVKPRTYKLNPIKKENSEKYLNTLKNILKVKEHPHKLIAKNLTKEEITSVINDVDYYISDKECAKIVKELRPNTLLEKIQTEEEQKSNEIDKKKYLNKNKIHFMWSGGKYRGPKKDNFIEGHEQILGYLEYNKLIHQNKPKNKREDFQETLKFYNKFPFKKRLNNFQNELESISCEQLELKYNKSNNIVTLNSSIPTLKESRNNIEFLSNHTNQSVKNINLNNEMNIKNGIENLKIEKLNIEKGQISNNNISKCKIKSVLKTPIKYPIKSLKNDIMNKITVRNICQEKEIGKRLNIFY